MYANEVKEYFVKEQAKSDLTIEKFCEKYGLLIRSFFRWKMKLEKNHTLERDKTNLGKSRKLKEDMLKKDIEEYPDSFYYERAKRLNCSKMTVFHAVHKFGFSHKKKQS